MPERSNLVNKSFNLSGVGFSFTAFSSEFIILYSGTPSELLSRDLYLSSLLSVLRSGANMGGTILAAETWATLVPLLRMIFSHVIF